MDNTGKNKSISDGNLNNMSLLQKYFNLHVCVFYDENRPGIVFEDCSDIYVLDRVSKDAINTVFKTSVFSAYLTKWDDSVNRVADVVTVKAAPSYQQFITLKVSKEDYEKIVLSIMSPNSNDFVDVDLDKYIIDFIENICEKVDFAFGYQPKNETSENEISEDQQINESLNTGINDEDELNDENIDKEDNALDTPIDDKKEEQQDNDQNQDLIDNELPSVNIDSLDNIFDDKKEEQQDNDQNQDLIDNELSSVNVDSSDSIFDGYKKIDEVSSSDENNNEDETDEYYEDNETDELIPVDRKEETIQQQNQYQTSDDFINVSVGSVDKISDEKVVDSDQDMTNDVISENKNESSDSSYDSIKALEEYRQQLFKFQNQQLINNNDSSLIDDDSLKSTNPVLKYKSSNVI